MRLVWQLRRIALLLVLCLLAQFQSGLLTDWRQRQGESQAFAGVVLDFADQTRVMQLHQHTASFLGVHRVRRAALRRWHGDQVCKELKRDHALAEVLDFVIRLPGTAAN